MTGLRITSAQLIAGLGLSQKTADWWVDPLNEVMATYQIDTRNRISAFLAQLAHESGKFHYLREIWGPTSAQTRYEGRRDLGNSEPGDGKRYLGRGLIQITGRANYRRVTAEIRKKVAGAPDFEAYPELLELPRWGAMAAGAYWDWNHLNEVADQQAFTTLTRRINGGTNGLRERKKYWNQLLEVLG